MADAQQPHQAPPPDPEVPPDPSGEPSPQPVPGTPGAGQPGDGTSGQSPEVVDTDMRDQTHNGTPEPTPVQFDVPVARQAARPEASDGNDYADLTDEEQVALIRQTDNGLRPEDEAIEQPPQDPNWRPDDAHESA